MAGEGEAVGAGRVATDVEPDEGGIDTVGAKLFHQPPATDVEGLLGAGEAVGAGRESTTVGPTVTAGRPVHSLNFSTHGALHSAQSSPRLSNWLNGSRYEKQRERGLAWVWK